MLCALEAIKKLSAEVESLLMNLAELRKGREDQVFKVVRYRPFVSLHLFSQGVKLSLCENGSYGCIFT